MVMLCPYFLAREVKLATKVLVSVVVARGCSNFKCMQK